MRVLTVSIIALLTWSPIPAGTVIGDVRSYEVAESETLTSIAARFGIEARVLAQDNARRLGASLRAGDRLTIDNRHIAPGGRAPGVVLNVPQRMLFVFGADDEVRAFPVAVGRADWRTPLGTFEVAVKEVDPVWDVPVSIQREMAQKGQRILTTVPPGPDNPLGNRWLGLSGGAVGIHGTNQPASIYRFTTHGCIRLHPDDMLALFELVTVGTTVELVYEPVLLAIDGAGTVFLEVHRDVYHRTGQPELRVNELLRHAGLETLAASPRIRRVIAEQAGRAVVVAE